MNGQPPDGNPGCIPGLLAAGLMLGLAAALAGEIGRGWEVLSREPGPAGLEVFHPAVRRWERSIARWARIYGLDPRLIATVMQIESCGDPRARSPAGAIGLFQVMPFHFTEGKNPWDPEVNARAGLRYLAGALRQARGDVARALAGYNGGHGLIHRPPATWPQETRRYVRWGTGIYQDAIQGRVPSPTLAQWMRAGGQFLCQQALRSPGPFYPPVRTGG